MIKRSIYFLAIASLAFASCKKEQTTIVPQEESGISKTATQTSPQDRNLVPPPPPPADGKYPEMTFNSKEHDFGVINQGDRVDYTFEFKNTGEADLIISNARGTCGCTVPEYPKVPIKPGQTEKIKVSFNSASKKGKTGKSVFITCNTKSGKEELKIKAIITVPEGTKQK
jgi:hypothetical protein